MHLIFALIFLGFGGFPLFYRLGFDLGLPLRSAFCTDWTVLYFEANCAAQKDSAFPPRVIIRKAERLFGLWLKSKIVHSLHKCDKLEFGMDGPPCIPTRATRLLSFGHRKTPSPIVVTSWISRCL